MDAVNLNNKNDQPGDRRPKPFNINDLSISARCMNCPLITALKNKAQYKD